ncbi:MAG: dihydroorotate dehydrogenase (quinone) [Bacteroidetes bacterium GWC2_33_15]|nr:MAG: dihydroorotate dehydrogenase (quinone) [Bacteroidetes bacterium GWA2_33_15]OFX50665.1 MAG: dihydroorotate dehydrogenase (quinone) [Bacteroidetes bacterium GWC2_33_15]OFX63239.1 MAG: dihydroorotate dehydrogenase (quinone) [Bacteroidetes bacterium GWB2_32_14]OFX69814.1 MAG: dihydroorotate dehydrogenase (quinone) [Bacteroidetes bacterium GWD2_33_33]HAN19857.1 dihydroorotate dehydrogenase (quinone) [Bacteroidales bacterium]
MYKIIIRPLLFFFPPETIHSLIVNFLKIGFKIPGVEYIVRKSFTINNNRLKTQFLGMEFKNPVGFAAGFDKNAEIYNQFSSFGFSFIEIGTVTPKPQPGNPKPRSFRIPKDNGLINRMGFNNKGVECAVNQLKNKKHKTIIGGNIGKNTNTANDNAIDDYVICFEKLYEYVDYFVVNLSCPNIKDLHKLQGKDSTITILNKLTAIRNTKALFKPILLKISPDLTNDQLDDIIETFKITRIDGIVATNTTISREGLITDKQTIDKIANGGLSGKPLAKRSTEIIRYLNEKSAGSIPIIGVGGIMSVDDALEKIKAGATLIQVYTGFIYEGPGFVKKINREILKIRS